MAASSLPELQQSATDDLADFRFARRVVRLHRLGPRALFELLAEIGARHLIRVPVEHIVREYTDRLDRDTLRARLSAIACRRYRSIGSHQTTTTTTANCADGGTVGCVRYEAAGGQQ
jgi:hypothetical protein